MGEGHAHGINFELLEETGFLPVVQAGLELLTSGESPLFFKQTSGIM